MILLITSQGNTLESPVEHRFGRCAWFIRYDTESKAWQAFENPGVSRSGGAGVAAGQFAVDQHVDLVVSGDFGPNAASVFRSANIQMHLLGNGISTVQQAVNAAVNGQLAAFA